MPELVEKVPAEDESAGVGSAQANDAPPSAADPIQKEPSSRVGKVGALTDIPEIATYLRRIGAKAVSFKKARIEEVIEGYPKTIGRVDFDAEGSVSVSGSAPLPTDAEQAAILAAWARVVWPEYRPCLSTGRDLPRGDDKIPWSRADEANVHVVWDERREHIRCVEERRPHDDGRKDVWIWTYWDDGIWRVAEPPSPMPLYGLETVKPGVTVYIHEGPKKASSANRLIHDDGRHEAGGGGVRSGGWRDHPFGAELRGDGAPLSPVRAAHVAWLGGAFRADEADWASLARLSPSRIAIVCDHDEAGEAAVGTISRTLLLPMTAVLWDARFPPGFDIADPVPDCMFEERDGERRYIGPSLSDLERDATWATRLVPSPDNPRRMVASIRAEFAKNWVFVQEPGVFVPLAQPTRQLKPQDFNNAVRPVSDVEDTAKAYLKTFGGQVESFTYDPGHPTGVLQNRFNSHMAPNIRRTPGDASMLIDYFSHLMPAEADRHHVMRWVATYIARPGTRMSYGLLLASKAQGVGKTWLAERILGPISGARNVSFPSEQDIKDKYTAWIGEKRLIAVEEIYSGDKHEIYNKLKPYITQNTIPVRRLYTGAYDAPNFAHFILTSNASVPMPLAPHDRRWLVPRVTEERRAREFWTAFLRWLESDGLSITIDWAHRFVEEHGAVQPGDIAPDTDRKAEMIGDAVSDIDKIIRDAVDGLMSLPGEDGPRSVLVMLDEFQTWLAELPAMRGKRAPSTNRIVAAMRDAGMTVFDGKDRPKLNGRNRNVALNFDKAQVHMAWPALAQMYRVHVPDVLGDL
jgi:hypothetical protein